MMLSLNEIRARAAQFSKKWENETYEKAEAQSFYNDFFKVFGIERRNVAIYEKSVKKLNNKSGFIDLFWPKMLLAEHKSAGHDLEKAMKQAEEYFLDLEEKERPRFMMACDFQNFKLVDLDEGTSIDFTLPELSDKI